MNWIVAKMKWVMLGAGVLTCAMLVAAVLPHETMDFLFDRTLESALAEVIVPSWAVLVGMVGGMLIYGAFVPEVRTLVLSVAGTSKLAFMGLMLWRGRQHLDQMVSGVLGLDALMVALFAVYLIGARRSGVRREPAFSASPSPTPAPRAEAGVRLAPRQMVAQMKSRPGKPPGTFSV
jgi:hypothetical protein